MKKFLFSIAKLTVALSFVGITASTAHAQYSTFASDEDFATYNEYFQITEPNSNLENAVQTDFDLLKFEKRNEKFPMPAEPYNRDRHFGGWLRDTTDGNCLNTRGKVLLRDSISDVSYTQNGCTIDKGEWDDPYTARIHVAAKDIQIDHLVALKNAYMTGAHEWDFKKRCLYANYMGNKFHLLSVNGRENIKKSDHTPSGYIPPNRAYTCEFIKNWLNVKLIWGLRITPKEGGAINRIVSDNHCDPQSFKVSPEALRAQREFMESHANLCDTSTGTTSIERFR